MMWLVVALLFGLTIAMLAGLLLWRGGALRRAAVMSILGPPSEAQQVTSAQVILNRADTDGAVERPETAESKALDDVLLELSHRTKNQLSTILGIISRLRRSHPEASAFCDNLTSRIHGIAACQDVLMDWAWSAPAIEDVGTAVLSRHFQDVAFAFSDFDVDNSHSVRIEPRSVQNFGLILNEIAHSSIVYCSPPAKALVEISPEPADRDHDSAGPSRSMLIVTVVVVCGVPPDNDPATPLFGEFADILARQAFGSRMAARLADGDLVYTLRLPPEAWLIAEDRN